MQSGIVGGMEVIADKYEVVRQLGAGGYGNVYLVRHIDLGVLYAMKVLSRSLSEDELFIERFKREAEILFRFSHRGSAQLRDFGKTGTGLYYMTVDYCPGEVLHEVIDREKWLPVLTVLDIVSQTLEVLDAAHTVGIIHRDIKPANIMVEWDDDDRPSIKILDFGIAKLRDQALTSTVTREGVTIGTPQYMSPEQASGQADLDHRVDLYATGVVMYELITGRVPFQGETMLQTLLKHLTQPPKPFAAELGVPAEVEAIVMKALVKDREQRYQSAREFRKDCMAVLEALRSSNIAPVRETPPAREVEAAVTPPPPTATGKKTKILCLDDNEMILNIMKHLLEREGYEVYTATNFSSIYDFIFREGAHLMLCDVEMPGLPGSKICKMLKRTLSDKLKIILFSNINERELEKLSIESKADAWLSKGAKPEEWLAKVRSFEGIEQ